MRECDIEQLVADYLHEVVEARGGDEREAADRVQSLVLYDPESAWEVALQVLRLADIENTACIVGAGIIEQLLGSYPEQFMPRATKIALEDNHVRRALKYVDIRADEFLRSASGSSNRSRNKYVLARSGRRITRTG